jgi:hypothetical protein
MVTPHKLLERSGRSIVELIQDSVRDGFLEEKVQSLGSRREFKVTVRRKFQSSCGAKPDNVPFVPGLSCLR